MDKLTPEEIKELKSWHAWLDDNRGDRARLRRAESAEDILLTDAFFHFLNKMPQPFPQKLPEDQRLYVAATIAGLISHVEEDDSTRSFPTQLATPQAGKNKAPMSELRFQQLQKSPTIDDFYRRIIRAIRLLGKSVNIASLANDIIHWHQEFEKPIGRHPAKRLAVHWATDYFTALPKNSD